MFFEYQNRSFILLTYEAVLTSNHILCPMFLIQTYRPGSLWGGDEWWRGSCICECDECSFLYHSVHFGTERDRERRHGSNVYPKSMFMFRGKRIQ